MRRAALAPAPAVTMHIPATTPEGIPGDQNDDCQQADQNGRDGQARYEVLHGPAFQASADNREMAHYRRGLESSHQPLPRK